MPTENNPANIQTNMNKAQLFKHLKGDTDIEKLEYLRSIGHPKNGPIYVQQKYNGVHCRALVNKDGVTFYTKPSDVYPDGKEWLADFFDSRFKEAFKELVEVIEAPTNFYGELIIPHTRLQDIAGEVAVNRKELGPYAKKDLLLVIYDCFVPNELIVNQPFSRRMAMVQRLIDLEHPGVYPADTTAMTALQADAAYQRAVSLGLEGVMYRVDPCFMVDGSPTWHFIKRKQRYDMEGTVLIVHEGKGKHRGYLGSLEVILPSGAIVKVGRGEGWTEERLAKLWTERASLIGKTITFSYEEMSKAGIPLRNQLVAIRNYES